jgi:tartrate dehydrogenase/decarboxylase/D-malate dehydrogenase
VANPIGTILSGALMLEHLGQPEEAARLHKAVDATTAAGRLPRDLGGTASTEDVVSAVLANLDR